MKKYIILALFLQSVYGCFAQRNEYPVQITNPQEQVRLVGQLGKALGNVLTVVGVVVNKTAKGYRSGLNIIIQTINDSSIQERITIPLVPYSGRSGSKLLPKLEKGATYRLQVYETGAFVGMPAHASKLLDKIEQTTGFYFQNSLVVLAGEKVQSIQQKASGYSGQTALIAGIAANENDTAYIHVAKEKVRVIGFRKWSVLEVGKLVEVRGKIEPTTVKGLYQVQGDTPRLVRLEDQIGRTVQLRGRAMSLNGYWWFNYRGTDIYVDKMQELPNWSVANHFQPMEIRGVLE